MAKKEKMQTAKKLFTPQELKHARAIAGGLEASFTEPAPPGAMAPAPLIDEIREMGVVGLAGMFEHLSASPPESRAAILRTFREVGDSSAAAGLLERGRSLRWVPEDLAALRETIEALDPAADIPPELDVEAVAQAQGIAGELAQDDALSAEAAASIRERLASLPGPLQVVALGGALSSDALSSGGAQTVIALAGAFAEAGAAPHLAIIDALAAEATVEAAEVLSRLADSVKDKAAGSRIRKALFRLKGKGVAPVEAEVKSSHAPATAASGIDYVRAVVSTCDGAGNLMLWVARSRQPRGRSLYQARVRHGRGIEEFVSTDISSKELRDFFNRLTQDENRPTVDVPAGYAFWLLQRAQAANEGEGGSAMPYGFTHAKLLLARLAEPEVFPFPGGHLVRRLIEPASGDDGRIENKEMLANATFWTWVLEEPLVVLHFNKCVEALQSEAASDDEQRRALFDKGMVAAAAELYENEKLRARLAAQLEDNAYLLHLRGEGDMARESLALSDLIAAGAPQPEFFTEMVRYSIGTMLDRAIRQSQGASKQAQGQQAHNHDHDHEHDHTHGESGPMDESSVVATP